jgi:hypothetical protein
MKFDSTALPQTSEPKEIQKMGLDLLDKINQTHAAIPTIPAAGGPFAPLPQAAAGVGQWEYFESGTGIAFILPAGGTWSYFACKVTAASGTFAATSIGGVAAGGTTVGAASAGVDWIGFVWRIA